MHGISKIEAIDGSGYCWGEFRHNMKESYCTYKTKDEVTYSQYKNDKANGYGIAIWPNGREYRGELKDSYTDGFGIMKYENNDEEEGRWMKNGGK